MFHTCYHLHLKIVTLRYTNLNYGRLEKPVGNKRHNGPCAMAILEADIDGGATDCNYTI